jgi:predicted deacetylase
MSAAGLLAVAIHDVEPATFERCALIRDWLDDLGVQRTTLLVIPAPDLHPFHDRWPGLASWLDERSRAGDAIAQHGFQHRRASARGGSPEAEFVGLDAGETRRAVRAGWRVLRLAGVAPRGFVAPAYAYTPALRATLASSYEWWATLGRVHRAAGGSTLSPAFGLDAASAPHRLGAPWLARLGAVVAGPLLRLDLHPADLDRPRRIGAAEAVLLRSRSRVAVTYDDLA